MKKDIFLVDADDTVLDFHGAAAQAIKFSFASVGIEWKEEYAGIYAALNAKLWEALERKEITREALMNTRFPQFLTHLGYTASEGERCNRAYIEYLSNNPIYFDGAENFLTALRKIGRVYIVTNGTSYIQKSRFQICELSKDADGIFISESVGYDKPAKGFSDYVYAHIPNFEKSRAVWIGDSLSADIKCANDSGADSIWFTPKHKPITGSIAPTYTAHSFAQILQILQDA